MQRTNVLVGTLVAMMAMSAGGCINLVSDDGAKAFSATLASGLRSWGAAITEQRDLIYVTQSFYRRQKRWPSTVAELKQFVADSDDYLVLSLGPNADVQFLPSLDGSVEVLITGKGTQSRATIKIPDPTPPPVAAEIPSAEAASTKAAGP